MGAGKLKRASHLCQKVLYCRGEFSVLKRQSPRKLLQLVAVNVEHGGSVVNKGDDDFHGSPTINKSNIG
ncbi:hypothetical protein ATANTOWER_013456 [Ataeniobius toweri]|uniref:Uncharacterized protein n=1 Tax=Ataeniobius toweri TaxID=208326 RepID=A0ABU7AB60_9TELE|nr:hypothetical protein [Ataeniobius toweri]